MSKKPTVLMILDGYGLNKRKDGNAVALADTPVMDKLMADYPFVEGQASGLAVGLPEGQMGNSEVGHLNMGAGRIVYQELTRITKEIEDGDFFKNEALLAACKNAKENNSALHLYGLVSDGGVHSHITHIYGLLELAKREGVEKIYVHCFLDGRDTPPASGKGYVEQLEAKMKEIGVGEVVSVMGRYYAMDRDNRWDRVELAYNALVKGEGVATDNIVKAIQESYDNEKTDEFVIPAYLEKDGIVLYNQELSCEDARTVLDILRRTGLVPVMEGKDYMYYDPEEYTNDVDWYAEDITRILGRKFRTIRDNEDRMFINKISAKAVAGSDVAAAVEGLKPWFTAIIHESEGFAGGTVEFVPNGYSKALGMAVACRLWDIPVEDTVCFGDSNNDLEMFSYAHTKVAMRNASPKLLEMADYVTEDMFHFGIRNGLRYLGLID